MRSLAVLVLALALTGCGGAREHGTATLWVTKDRGTHVVFTGTVPAGLTAMQALDRKLKITTRYGGRFVQSIDGVEGSLQARHDWFYFVNGLEGDRSAGEVRLRPGDVEWWDYRSWTGPAMSVPVVAGAYPAPFRGSTTSVVGVGIGRPVLTAIARQVGGTVDAKAPTRNYIVVSTKLPGDTVRIRRFRKGVLLELGESAARSLAHDAHALRYRYGDTP